jgi:hypothetical protein
MKRTGQAGRCPMNTQQLAFAAIFEPHSNSEYAKRQAQLTPVNSRRSPLPSAGDIDAAMQRKYGARRFGEI